MKRYIKSNSDIHLNLLKECIKHVKSMRKCSVTIKNGGIEVFYNDDPSDLAAHYAYLSDMYDELDKLLEDNYTQSDIVEWFLDDFDFSDSIFNARGSMSYAEFKRRRQELREKYLKEIQTDDNYDIACKVFKSIYSELTDKDFDESFIFQKTKKIYILKGPIEGHLRCCFLDVVDWNSIFTESELSYLDSFENMRVTYTGLIDLGNDNQNVAKKYNKKIKDYVNTVLSKFQSDEYTLKLLSGSGNIQIAFN